LTREGLPELDRVAPLALVVEAVDAVDRGALVVAAQLVRVRVRVRVRFRVRVRVRIRAGVRVRVRIRVRIRARIRARVRARVRLPGRSSPGT
jgi:hypothetical protein